MNIRLATGENDPQLWDEYVSGHAECSNYHRWGWKRVVEESFQWPTFYFVAEKENTLQGILPIVWQKSLMFGSFLTSLPFLNGGGVAAESAAAKEALVAAAVELAKRLRVGYLELRHRIDPQLNLPTKAHKVAMVLPLEAHSEKMLAVLPHKVRTDIRKGIKSGLTAECGGEELLDDFYDVFAQNMRDLGTPVYAKTFFSTMLKVFPKDNFICVIRHEGKAVASSFLLGYRRAVEAGWSAARYNYLPMRPNMFLYWNILCSAVERGYLEFDFGRSSIGSGTYRFKKQWGAREIPLVWAYWVPNHADLPEVNKENPRYQLAIRCWQKLPVSFTKLVGPAIVKCLP